MSDREAYSYMQPKYDEYRRKFLSGELTIESMDGDMKDYSRLVLFKTGLTSLTQYVDRFSDKSDVLSSIVAAVTLSSVSYDENYVLGLFGYRYGYVLGTVNSQGKPKFIIISNSSSGIYSKQGYDAKSNVYSAAVVVKCGVEMGVVTVNHDRSAVLNKDYMDAITEYGRSGDKDALVLKDGTHIEGVGDIKYQIDDIVNMLDSMYIVDAPDTMVLGRVAAQRVKRTHESVVGSDRDTVITALTRVAEELPRPSEGRTVLLAIRAGIKGVDQAPAMSPDERKATDLLSMPNAVTIVNTILNDKDINVTSFLSIINSSGQGPVITNNNVTNNAISIIRRAAASINIDNANGMQDVANIKSKITIWRQSMTESAGKIRVNNVLYEAVNADERTFVAKLIEDIAAISSDIETDPAASSHPDRQTMQEVRSLILQALSRAATLKML